MNEVVKDILKFLLVFSIGACFLFILWASIPGHKEAEVTANQAQQKIDAIKKILEIQE